MGIISKQKLIYLYEERVNKIMKERKIYDCKDGCSVESTLQFIAGKWKSVILFHLLQNEKMHFGEIQKEIGGCSRRMLALQLNELEEDGIVNKKVYSVRPAITEYTLTDFGKSLEPVIMAMNNWGASFNEASA